MKFGRRESVESEDWTRRNEEQFGTGGRLGVEYSVQGNHRGRTEAMKAMETVEANRKGRITEVKGAWEKALSGEVESLKVLD